MRKYTTGIASVLMLLWLFISCGTHRDVVKHFQRGGVMPHGTNKKLNKFEKNK